MACSDEFPITPGVVLSAKTQGLRKTNAPTLLAEMVPTFDHKPMVQSLMDKAVKSYQPPCWMSGMRKEVSGKLHSSALLLHRSLLNGIKQQLRDMLPSRSLKDALVSGDMAVAIRFPEAPGGSSSSASSDPMPPVPGKSVRIFLLSKVVLRPEFAVMMEMDVDMKSRTASLRADGQTGISCASSFDVACGLLSQSPSFATTPMWVNVLVRKPLFLVHLL